MVASSTTTRALGSRGEALIKRWETLSLVAYRKNNDNTWTIGWGSTRNVHEGMAIDIAEASRRFDVDTRATVDAVNRLPADALKRLSQSYFDALVDLVFNVGERAIDDDSTIGRFLRAGDIYAAWRALALWTKIGKRDTRGLARRRADEMLLAMEDRLP